jgi:hypothetical protein
LFEADIGVVTTLLVTLLTLTSGANSVWAYARLNSHAPNNSYVNAGVQRKDGYTEYCVYTPQENGSIDKGQKSCYSPQIYDKNPIKSHAKAIVYDRSITGVTKYY